jgi:hypothetical protein
VVAVDLTELLALARRLEDELDLVIESSGDDLWAQQQADWAWFRFSSANVLIREEGGGGLAPALARGLLEQAAYWDWALATEAGTDHLARWASIEYERLERLATEVGDTTWLGWILPPGSGIASDGADGIPANAADAVNRLGAGLEPAVLAPLQFHGLFAAYRLLDVLAHSNLVAAQVMASGGGAELSSQMAAAVIHVAAASTTAVVIAVLDPDLEDEERLTRSVMELAIAASALHGLPLGQARQVRRPARARRGTPLVRMSDIEFMPEAAEEMSALGRAFVEASEVLSQEAVRRRLEPELPGVVIAWNSFQLAHAHLQILSGACSGLLGRALLPPAARALFEDGARWEWLVREVCQSGPTGAAIEALVTDGRDYLSVIRQRMISDGIPSRRFDTLVGQARNLLSAPGGGAALPPIEELIRLAYPTASGIESARPMYSVLSQFVHATPLSVLHLRQDEWHSLTAPTYAIAVESACRGFLSTATATARVACEPAPSLAEAVDELVEKLRGVTQAATSWHFLG